MQMAQWLAHSDNVSLFDDEGLRAHLARCPDPDHPEAKQLAGWLDLRSKTPVMSRVRERYLRFWPIRVALRAFARRWPVIWARFWEALMVVGLSFALIYYLGIIIGIWD